MENIKAKKNVNKIWKYNGKCYTYLSFKEIDEDTLFKLFNVSKICSDNSPLVYHIKWDKCFYLESYNYSGNGNSLKAYIEDIYNKKQCYCQFYDLGLVIQIQLENKKEITSNDFTILENFNNKIISNSKSLDKDFQKIVNENFWNLI